MSHSQGLSNNPYPEPNQPNSIDTYLFKGGTLSWGPESEILGSLKNLKPEK